MESGRCSRAVHGAKAGDTESVPPESDGAQAMKTWRRVPRLVAAEFVESVLVPRKAGSRCWEPRPRQGAGVGASIRTQEHRARNHDPESTAKSLRGVGMVLSGGGAETEQSCGVGADCVESSLLEDVESGPTPSQGAGVGMQEGGFGQMTWQSGRCCRGRPQAGDGTESRQQDREVGEVDSTAGAARWERRGWRRGV